MVIYNHNLTINGYFQLWYCPWTSTELLGPGPNGLSPWIPDCTSVHYFNFKRVAGWQPYLGGAI